MSEPDKLREFVSIHKGSYKVTSPSGKVTATYKRRSGYGDVVLLLGTVKIGEAYENEIEKYIQTALDEMRNLK